MKNSRTNANLLILEQISISRSTANCSPYAALRSSTKSTANLKCVTKLLQLSDAIPTMKPGEAQGGINVQSPHNGFLQLQLAKNCRSLQKWQNRWWTTLRSKSLDLFMYCLLEEKFPAESEPSHFKRRGKKKEGSVYIYGSCTSWWCKEKAPFSLPPLV